MQHAGVVVVGGGIMGLAAAYYLAREGITGVVVLERGHIGDGSTPRAAGMIRQQFANPLGVRLARQTLDIYRTFHAEIGVDPALRQPGYLILATSEREADAARRAVEAQRAEGLDSRFLAPEDIADLFPELQGGDIAGAGFCAGDGFVDPRRVLEGYAAAARRTGVTVVEEAAVAAITTEAGRVTGVRTPEESIETARVVNAAGAGAGAVAALAGDRLPVIGLEHQVVVTAQPPGLPSERPMVVDFGHGYYFYSRGDGLLVGMGGAGDRPGAAPGFDKELWAATRAELERRLPVAAGTPVLRRWTGVIDYTPDNLPVLGASPHVEGLFTAVSGGHGIMYGPGLALAAARLLAGREVEPGFYALSPARFDRPAAPDAAAPEAYSFSAPASAFTASA